MKYNVKSIKKKKKNNKKSLQIYRKNQWHTNQKRYLLNFLTIINNILFTMKKSNKKTKYFKHQLEIKSKKKKLFRAKK